jgi:hypothetical protein
VNIRKTVNKAAKAINKVLTNNNSRYFDMSDVNAREATVQEDYDYFLTQRSETEKKWIEKDNYYNGKHTVSSEIYNQLKEQGIPWVPATVPDSYIHVESQIIPDIPDFEFNGRDDDMDSKKAKQREYVVKYVLENNKIETMNTENERRLNILGNAFWKVSWDGSIEGQGFKGDIVIGNPGCENILPDPAAYNVHECEAFIYPYRMHRRKAARTFLNELKALDMTIDDIIPDGNQEDTEIFHNQPRDINDDTVQIVEYWFRQPDYGSAKQEFEVDGKTISKTIEWEPGDIACSIQINNTEIKYIPKYWVKTGKQNKRFPFVKYCKIPVYNSFWDKSDLDAMKDLQDQCDRELATAILNDAFMSNDMIVAEESSLSDSMDGKIPNYPGAVILTKSGMSTTVRRLGGLGQNGNRIQMIEFLRAMIQETVGNFDATQGKEPVRVTTASGIAQLNERADARKNIKKADRLTGFELLYELIDWTALEFYDDNRMIFIGATDEKTKGMPMIPGNMDKSKGAINFKFNSDNMRVLDAYEKDGQYYYPRVDATVTAGDGLRKSKAFTLGALENLVKMQITPENFKIVQAMITVMDLPQSKEIKEYLEQLFAQPQQPVMGGEQPMNVDDILNQLTPEEMAELEANPELLDELMQGGQI